MPRARRRKSNYYSRVYVNNYSYNNTSEAYELYTDYEEYEQQSRRKRAQKVKRLERSGERVPLTAVKVLAGSAVICAMAVGVVNINAGNSARRSEILQMREQLEAINENNAYLETKLNETVDLRRIEEIAETRLGMSKPKSYQIKYIDVQKESYTVQYGVQTEEKLTFAKAVSNLFKD